MLHTHACLTLGIYGSVWYSIATQEYERNFMMIVQDCVSIKFIVTMLLSSARGWNLCCHSLWFLSWDRFLSHCLKVMGVVYYVVPTEQISPCHRNSITCPPGQVCHTMDYFTESGNKFFSTNHVNITLIFMCGVHKCTKDLTVQNLHSFDVRGETETKENVIINMHHQEIVEIATQSSKLSCTTIHIST